MNEFTEKMSDKAEKVSGKVKGQASQVNESFQSLVNAGRGLVFKITETSSKQFESLAKMGESKRDEGKTIVSQVKDTFADKASVSQLRYAAIGLVSKALENSEKYFNELAKLGESKKSPKTRSKTKAAA